MDINNELNSLSIELLADYSENQIDRIIEQAAKSTEKLEKGLDMSTSDNST